MLSGALGVAITSHITLGGTEYVHVRPSGEAGRNHLLMSHILLAIDKTNVMESILPLNCFIFIISHTTH